LCLVNGDGVRRRAQYAYDVLPDGFVREALTEKEQNQHAQELADAATWLADLLTLPA
jgi:hypothetical protein